MDAGGLNQPARRTGLRALAAWALVFTGAARAAPAPRPLSAVAWAWTDTELWCRLPGSAWFGPWPRSPDDAAPVAVRGGLWWPKRDALVFLSAPGPGNEAPAESFHWPRPAADVAQPWVWAALASGRWAAAAGRGHDVATLHLIDRLGPDSLDHPGQALEGRALGSVRALAALDGRQSLLVDWSAGGQWWEVSLDPAAPAIHDGLVHDWRLGEALPKPGYRQPRRLPLVPPEASPPRLRQAWPDRPFALAQQGDRALIVHLDVRRPLLAWPLDGAAAAAPHWPTVLVDGALYVQAGMAWSRIDTRRWQRVEGLTPPALAAAPAPEAPAAAPGRPGPWRGFAVQPG